VGEGFIKYAVEMGLDAMLYIPSFMKNGSGIQKLLYRDSQIHRQHGDLISLLLFLQNKKSRLEIKINAFHRSN
jgi:hypothetical protein